MLNPRLADPDEAIVPETGEIIEVHHAYEDSQGIWYGCRWPTGYYQMKHESNIRFLTNKYDWKKTLSTDRRSQLARAHWSKHAAK